MAILGIGKGSLQCGSHETAQLFGPIHHHRLTPPSPYLTVSIRQSVYQVETTPILPGI